MKKILLAQIYLEVLKIKQKQKIKLKKMGQELDKLKATVEANGTLIASAITLIQTLKAGNDPAAITAATDDLSRQQQDLTDVIAANTPTP